jgi:parallel beta-helix repeat protein
MLSPINSPQNGGVNNDSILNVKSAGYWDINNTNIHVDGNWSETAAAYDWVSGSGTWADPFLIENVTIDGVDANSTIIINNTSDYFKINNCTLYDSPTGVLNGSIILNNASNGQIIDVEMYSGGYGIWINDSSNITISDCYIRVNSNDGIYIGNSNNITINGSTDLYNNIGHGVYFNNSDNNTVCYSIIRNNDLYGIYLDNESDDNWIYENYVGYNKYDMVLETINSQQVNVCYYIIDNGQDNTIVNNDEVGSCTPSPIYGTLPDPPASYDWILYVVAGVALLVLCGFANKRYKNYDERLKKAPARTDKDVEKLSP